MRQRFDTSPVFSIVPIENVKIARQSAKRVLEKHILAGKAATGRTGMDLWKILVLGVTRLALNADWDRMEHLANYDSLSMPELRRLIHVPKSCPAPLPAPLDWAQEELACARLPNQRLRNRAMVLARDFFAKPQANIAQACGSLAKTKAAYRFFDHHCVSMQAVLSGHYEASARRAAKESVVLAVQDTTDLNYSAHWATQQLGEGKGVA